MNGYDRHQMLSALILMVLALFVSSAYPPLSRWHPQLRVGAGILFVIALALALVEIVRWWATGRP